MKHFQGSGLLSSLYPYFFCTFVQRILRHAPAAGWIVTLCICLTLLYPPLALAAKSQNVLLVYQQQSPFNQQLIELIESDLRDKGYQASRLLLESATAEKKSDLNQYDLLIAIGSRSTKQLLDSQTKQPILSVLMPRHLADSLSAAYPDANNWSSLLIDQPVERHFHLITSIMGENQQAGVLLGPYTEKMKSSLEKAASRTQHHISTQNVENSDQLMASLKALNDTSNVLLTLPDPIIFNQNTIRGILLSSYRSKLPIIGFSRAYVKAGAIAAVYSQPGQISKQAVKIADYLLVNKRFKKKKYYPEEFSVALNNKVAHSLGIDLETSSTIVKRIKEAEK